MLITPEKDLQLIPEDTGSRINEKTGKLEISGESRYRREIDEKTGFPIVPLDDKDIPIRPCYDIGG